jgi:FHA domain
VAFPTRTLTKPLQEWLLTDTDDSTGARSEPFTGWGRVEVHPGTGIVHRGDDVLLVVPLSDGPLAQPTLELIRCCSLGPDPTGRRRLRQAAWLATRGDPDQIPSFALLIRSSREGVVVMAQGAVTITIHGGKELSFSGSDSLAWVERMVDLTYETLIVASSDPSPLTADMTVPLDLLAGTVPGGGVTLRREAALPGDRHAASPLAEVQEPARVLSRLPYGAAPMDRPVPSSGATPAHRPARSPEPGGDHPAAGRSETVLRRATLFRSVPLAHRPVADADARRQPLPVGSAATSTQRPQRAAVVIEGVVCPCGHFNEPEASSCEACGAAVDDTGRREARPRPPLGVLVTDEGSVYTVAGDYVIGREPQQAPAVRSGKALPLVMEDPEQSTSRVHAYLRLSGWKVLVSDGGSANGTFVSKGGSSGPWVAVPAEPGTRLLPGDRVRVGQRQMLFDRYPERLTP